MFLETKRAIGAALETTPGTAVSATYDFQAREISYSHELEEYAVKYASGNMSMHPSVLGIRTGSVSFVCEFKPGSAAATAPAISKLLQACGVAETTYGAVGVSWDPSSSQADAARSLTIEIQEKNQGASPSQLVIKLAGCVGNCRVVLGRIGQPIRFEFEFTGKLVAPADRAFGSIVTPTVPTEKSNKVLSGTLNLNSITQYIESFTLDFGNDVQPFLDGTDTTGILNYYIAGREPTLSWNPIVKLLATENWWSDWSGETTRALSIVAPGTHDLTISAPALQRINPSVGGRNGGLIHDWSAKLIGSSGDDEFQILQGATS